MQYSILPIQGLENPVEYCEIEYDGYLVLACKTPEGYRLQQLYSTNPSDFLKPNLQPGILLENRLIKPPNQ